MRRLGQDLSALVGSIGRPVISTLVSWGCIALAYPLARKGGYAGAVAAALVLSLSVFFLAYVLGSGALAFGVDAKRVCLPGSRRLARRADLLASVLLLPALVLSVAALAGNPVWPVWVAPVLVLAIALAGVLAPRRPASAVALFLLVVLAARWAMSGWGDHGGGKEWHFALLATALVLVTAALPLSVAVDWHRVTRRGSRPQNLEERSRTSCIRIEQPEPPRHAPQMGASRHGAWERQPSVQIVRNCLGGMFVQFSRQLIIVITFVALFIMAAVLLPWLGASGLRWVFDALVLTAAGLVSAGFLTQISNLTRAQLAELALLPGLGAPAAQRRALCRAVLAAPLLWVGGILLLGSAGLLLEGEPLANLGLLAACLLILWLSYATYALQKLVTLPPKPQSFLAEFMLLWIGVYAAGVYYGVYTTHPQIVLGFRFWFWIAPVLFCVGIAGAIGFSVRRLATAPHPFLS
jgi:hypothetical protein